MTSALTQTTIPPGLPDRTLGWAILVWAAKYLRQPDGPNAGDPFFFTREQMRLILWWYAVDDRGRFLFNSGVVRRMKGWGKDPYAAALCLIELCGPTAFSHFEGTTPIGKQQPAPWVQVAAVSRDQTRNTFTLFPTMCSQELIEEYRLDINKEIIHKKAGGRIEAVTSSPKSLEGGRSHFVVMNETQFWLENNNGHEMAGAIQGNTAKGRGGSFRRLAICNAHRPGEDSIAEHDYEAFEKLLSGGARFSKFMYDALEAPSDTDMADPDSLKRGVTLARGDSHWLDVERLVEEIYDPRTIPSEARRKYLNQIVAAEDAWLAPWEWDAVGNDLLKLRDDDEITLGFDGSRGNDHTALCACRISDGAIFLLSVWNPQSFDDKKIPTRQVDAAIRLAMKKYRVVAFRADVKEFEAYVDLWERDFGHLMKVKASPGNPIKYDMRSKGKKDFLENCETFRAAVIDGKLQHNANPILRQHIVNARQRASDTHDLIGIGKESKDSSRKIDAAVTAILAFAARQDYMKSKGNKSRGLTIV
jgi:hypothetical protein